LGQFTALHKRHTVRHPRTHDIVVAGHWHADGVPQAAGHFTWQLMNKPLAADPPGDGQSQRTKWAVAVREFLL
jgi:hypothetical protein